MKCLRCGYCCKNYKVIIIDDPEKGITEDNLMIHEGNGFPCKHLRGNKPGEYFCVLHDKPYYKDLPCFSHKQTESNLNSVCRIGKFILNKTNSMRS